MRLWPTMAFVSFFLSLLFLFFSLVTVRCSPGWPGICCLQDCSSCIPPSPHLQLVEHSASSLEIRPDKNISPNPPFPSPSHPVAIRQFYFLALSPILSLPLPILMPGDGHFPFNFPPWFLKAIFTLLPGEVKAWRPDGRNWGKQSTWTNPTHCLRNLQLKQC